MLSKVSGHNAIDTVIKKERVRFQLIKVLPASKGGGMCETSALASVET